MQRLQPYGFLGLPLEIRFEIYSNLLPNIDIPAKCAGGRLRNDLSRTHLEILRVNRRIGSEALTYLYGARDYEVSISRKSIMFLGVTTLLQDVRCSGRWECPIGVEAFNLINSLKIIVDMRTTNDAPVYRSNVSRNIEVVPSATDDQQNSLPAGDTLYGMDCTARQLQETVQLIGVLVHQLSAARSSVRQPLSKLMLTFAFNNASPSPDNFRQVISMTRHLLTPFWCLRNITDPSVESIRFGQFNENFVFEKVELIEMGDGSAEAEVMFSEELKEFRRTLMTTV